ncbi:H-NS histone family protein [Burkholderia ubonensis]|uniref:H-NS histone family protein n=1 Tax=Burkholderia ubonensis TaxID=101571 RepID=UPI0009B31417|nr:H-NS histone family protein [Burkholderia ubonensis]
MLTELITDATNDLHNLQSQLRKLNIHLSDVKKDEKQALLATIQENVALYGIAEDELLRAAGFRKSGKQRAPAKFYDSSTGKTWSGHGPRPKWLEEKILRHASTRMGDRDGNERIESGYTAVTRPGKFIST